MEKTLGGYRIRADKAKKALTSLFAARGVGHTTMVLEGAKNVPGAVYIVASHRHGMQLEQKYPGVAFLTLDDLERLRGIRHPVAIDHHALFLLMGAIVMYSEELEEENERLRK